MPLPVTEAVSLDDLLEKNIHALQARYRDECRDYLEIGGDAPRYAAITSGAQADVLSSLQQALNANRQKWCFGSP